MIRTHKDLTTNIRNQIEWHFIHYQSDVKNGAEEIVNIVDSGLIASYKEFYTGGGLKNPTEQKALSLAKKAYCYIWSNIVKKTYIKFEGEDEEKIMKKLYEQRKRLSEIDDVSESTLLRWRDKWLLFAWNNAIKEGVM